MTQSHSSPVQFTGILTLAASTLLFGCGSGTDGGDPPWQNGADSTDPETAPVDDSGGGTADPITDPTIQPIDGAPCSADDFFSSDCRICGCNDEQQWICTDNPECADPEPINCLASNCCGGTTTPLDACEGTWQCVSEQWTCYDDQDCPTVSPPPNTFCTGMVVNVENPETGVCCEYGSSCVAPSGWAACDSGQIAADNQQSAGNQ